LRSGRLHHRPRLVPSRLIIQTRPVIIVITIITIIDLSIPSAGQKNAMQQQRNASPTMSGPRPRRLLPSFASFLLVCLLLASQHFEMASADLLTLIINATNAPPGALDRAQADATTFLQKFVSLEGSSYRAIAPGQALPYSTTTTTTTATSTSTTNTDSDTSDNSVRMLRGGAPEDAEEEPVEGELNPLDSSSNRQGHRKLFDCPNQCSDSGSYTCRLLGCAYCGKCRRRDLQYYGGTSYNKHRNIENSISTDLSSYCNGTPGCSIRAVIKRVNAADGSMSLAV
jgi:hypothetical protein